MSSPGAAARRPALTPLIELMESGAMATVLYAVFQHGLDQVRACTPQRCGVGDRDRDRDGQRDQRDNDPRW